MAVNVSNVEGQPHVLTADPAAMKTDVNTQQPAEPPKPVSDPNAPILVKAEPAELDFGDIPTSDSKTGTVKLVNTGDKPMTINSARASCGCTALKVVPGTVLQPGETTEVEVRLNAPPGAGAISHKSVTFVIEGQPEIVVPLKGMAVSYVVTEPSMINAEQMPDGKFVVKAIDGQAFRVTGVQPPVIEGLPTESGTEHHLQMDFAKYRELGVNRKTVLYVDHPKCQQVYANVMFPQADYLAAAEKQRQNQPIQPGKGAPEQEVTPPVMSEDTQLAEMIRQGRNAEVMAKISSGLEVNHRDSTGASLLSLASKQGNVELMSALLAAGADKESQDNVGRTPLMNAAQAKSAAAIRVLLDAGASVSVRDTTPVRQTALHFAAGTSNAESVQELIDAGSEVDAVSNVVGWTSLIWAAGFGDPNSVPILIKAGANIEFADYLQGATPLINAARTGEVQSITELLKAGAQIENKDRTGKTAFLAAAEYSGGTAEKVQVLIDAGANINATDSRGLNALQLARKRTDPRGEAVVVLLEKHLGATTPAEGSETPAPAPGTPAPTPAPEAPATPQQ